MNTAKLKRFATEARNNLRQGVANRLVILGFDDAGVPMVSPELVPGGAVWGEKPCTVAFHRGFKSLEEQIRQYGVSHVVEEAAYTWFNRLMAIRILTMNELCEPVLRFVGSTRTPLIVDEARQGHIPDMDEEDREALMKLIDDDTKTAEQFAMLISAFCHNTPLIAKCFSLQSDYTDVLFPANILSENGFIDMLNTTDFITEEDYHSSELLGWLYQFYISEKKDQVFAKKGKYDADDIPAATQIFTPNWIVKYMVQNTIGGVLGGKDKLPENQRKYYVDTPEPPKAICRDIEELKVADLACGSGHILNECFDLLYELYISEGYTRREAIECIFTQNLTGIDIDTRAKQLATFALMLKACQRDSSLVDASLMPHVYDMSGMPEESRELGSIQIFDEPDSDNPVIAALSTHYDAIVMNPPYMGGGSMSLTLSNYVKTNYPKGKADLATVFVEAMPRLTKEGGKYAFIIPPSWMFLSGFESLRKSIIENQSIDSLLHLSRGIFGADFGSSSAVITNEKDPHAKGNYFRLIERTFQEFDQNHLRRLFEKTLKNPQFRFKFSDYSKEVEEIIYSKEGAIIYYPNVAQENFEKIEGCPFGYWASDSLIDAFQGEKFYDLFFCGHGLLTGHDEDMLRSWTEIDFDKIGFGFDSVQNFQSTLYMYAPIAKGGGGRKWYGGFDLVAKYTKQNVAKMKKWPKFTPQNEKRYFKEGVCWPDITSGDIYAKFFPKGMIFSHRCPSAFSEEQSELLKICGFLCSKPFSYIRNILNPTISVSAGTVNSTPIKNIQVWDDCITKTVEENIAISKQDWDAHETSWDFEKNPLLAVDTQTYMDNIDAQIEKHRLETGETLCIDPAAPQFDSLKWRYEQYCQKWDSLFMKLHANEEELNRRFIEIYGLQDELSPDVPLNEITILQQGEIKVTDQYNLTDEDGAVFTDEKGNRLTVTGDTYLDWQDDVVMKQFISYAVGCMMGRYRLDRPGLAIAHPNETPEEVAEYEIPSSEYQTPNTKNLFWIDTDGIIPLLPEDCGFHDNAVNRFATFVRQTLGDETQVENLNFIEECLGKSLEQYFIKDFWKDHKKMYQNRPIYWLFASKKGAFQVLVYVHRMNVATVERIRSRYLLPYIERLNKRIEDLQANESTLSTKQRNQLKTLRAQVAECEEYHNRLAVVAERGIVPNLDDGIIKNHALYGDIVSKLK